MPPDIDDIATNRAALHKRVWGNIKERSPLLAMTAASLTLLFIFAFLFMSFSIVFEIPKQCPAERCTILQFVQLVNNAFFGTIGVFDILLGLLGILVGYIIAVILDESDTRKTEETQSRIDQTRELIHQAHELQTSKGC